ncbi:hypothetical protein CEPID_00870 [Corynebacterium epidermidicanis]|uniref:Uncharacterized protein n=1 Tax=Corynebacterium epidermidicanis TaxID=1050174 RepID=A0A0G3GR68_9CORY|nr:hypothetical protein CEPID_00870 [Corynebacterium epidermidicanis]
MKKTLLCVVRLRRGDDIALVQQTRTAGDTPTGHTVLSLTQNAGAPKRNFGAPALPS